MAIFSALRTGKFRKIVMVLWAMSSMALFTPLSSFAGKINPCIPESASIRGYFFADFAGLQILMPKASFGKNIILPLNDDSELDEATRILNKMFQNDPAVIKKLAEFVPDSSYEKALVEAYPNLKMYSINGLLPEIVAKRFNRKLDFGGPNCYFTALSTTAGISMEEVRHVSLPEFTSRLAMFYTELPGAEPQKGDVLFFNSSEHGAVYLGGDWVFHKKDLNKEFYFRLAKKLEVFMPDPGEWTPGPNYCGPYSRPHNTKVNKIQVFRRNEVPLSAWRESVKDLPEFEISELLKKTTMEVGPAWKIGKTMGYWSELLSNEITKVFSKTLKDSVAGQNLIGELESTRDQIFICIEDNYFSSPYAKPDVIKEIWFHDNEYSRELIKLIRNYYGLKTTADDMKRILAALKAIDGEPRGKSMLAIIRS